MGIFLPGSSVPIFGWLVKMIKNLCKNSRRTLEQGGVLSENHCWATTHGSKSTWSNNKEGKSLM